MVRRSFMSRGAVFHEIFIYRPNAAHRVFFVIIDTGAGLLLLGMVWYGLPKIICHVNQINWKKSRAFLFDYSVMRPAELACAQISAKHRYSDSSGYRCYLIELNMEQKAYPVKT